MLNVSVSIQLVSLASREKGGEIARSNGRDVSIQLVSLASREYGFNSPETYDEFWFPFNWFP